MLRQQCRTGGFWVDFAEATFNLPYQRVCLLLEGAAIRLASTFLPDQTSIQELTKLQPVLHT